MKKGLFITLTSVALLAAPLNVLANGMSTVKVDGDKTATMGDIVEVKVKLTDIKDTLDGVVAFGGDLKYDKEYLEYVGSYKSEDTYEFLINEDILRIAGVDYTLENGIKDDTTVYTFKFKTLKEGKTTVDFVEPEVVDTDASVIESTVSPLDITISAKKEAKSSTKEVEKIVEVETKEEIVEVETKEEVKETGIISTITKVLKGIFNLFKKFGK